MGHLTQVYSIFDISIDTSIDISIFDILCLPHCGEFDIRVCQIPTMPHIIPRGGWWGNTLKVHYVYSNYQEIELVILIMIYVRIGSLIMLLIISFGELMHI